MPPLAREALILTLFVPVLALAQGERKAVVNGKPLTQADLDAVLKQAPPSVQPVIAKDPTELLRWYGLMDRMADEAEKAGLSAQSGVRERLALARKQILAEALSDKFFADHPVTDEDQTKFYAEHQDDYTSALVKIIFVPIKAAGQEAMAKTKANALAKQLAAGADFDKLADQYPIESSFSNVIRKADAAVPEAIRKAVFALEPGRTTTPIALPNGVYLFRLQSTAVKLLSDLRGEIVSRMANERFFAWMAEMRKTVVVEAGSQ